MTPVPDVSVVVIVYNDAARLPAAVRSVLDQTLRNLEVIIVDDASTDASPRVADELGAAHPDRVRVIHLPENSGGCSRPRNVGIDNARGTYIMFLDSDDTFDRNACMTLLSTAEETGAELVAGLTVREMVDTGKEVRWFPGLYQRSATYDSIRDHPDQLYDMLSTNKLYRLDLLNRHKLRFPEGLLYEDILFIAHAYLVANRIAIVPHRIYNWRIERKKGTLSISNRRGDLRNISDRLEIHRRIDAVYREHGADDLKLRKDTRFLDHDLLMHIRDLPGQNEEYRQKFQGIVRDYLAELDPQAYDDSHKFKAIAGYLMREGDIAGAMAAADYTPPKGQRPKISTPLVERDGRVYWCDRHLDTEEGRRILDVTELGLHQQPLSKLELDNTLTRLEADGTRLRLAGSLINPIGRIRPDAKLKCDLEFFDRRRPRRAVRVKARATHQGDRIGWDAEFEPGRSMRPLGFIDRVWDVRVHLTVGDEKITSRLSTYDVAHGGVAVPLRPRLTRLASDHLESYVTERSELAFQLVERGRPARAARAITQWITGTKVGRKVWSGIAAGERFALKAAGHPRTKVFVYGTLLRRLPIRKRTIVFESDLGREYGGNPKYIHEELRRSGAPYKPVWSYSGSTRGFPKGTKLVKRGSWAYHRALAQAEFWVDDEGGFPVELAKRPRTTYVQAWHGSAVKHMGLDRPDVKAASRGEQRRVLAEMDRFDHILVRSEHDVRALTSAFKLRAEPLRGGYPRNDALVTGGDPAELASLRGKLKLDDDRQVVLYAPTYREGPNAKPVARFEMPFDLERFAAELGDTHVLLVRPHPQTGIVVPPELRHAVRNVASPYDITSLMLLSDALITDYSPVMFDYSLLGRPVVFYTPDLDDHVRKGRGFYLDLAEQAPGPVTRDEEALFDALRDLDGTKERYATRLGDFAKRFGEYDSGTAAKSVVERLFTPGRTR
ncbi:CDP-glycerol glycerophosphotransferase family protein [Actinomadura sp. HBU206391]|nr:CDP-glycerol glycerophosphotransferase family protein [Actinomadura sp. HBU206391]